MNELDLKRIYDSFPGIECKGLCYDNCTVIPLSDLELKYIGQDNISMRFAVNINVLNCTLDEEEKHIPVCDMLVDNRCSIYDKRPMICRLYGVVRGIECPHGCKPERPLSEQGAKFLQEAIQGKQFSKQFSKKFRAALVDMGLALDAMASCE